MKIPDDIKDQIRDRADIVEVIGEVVDLKKRGANYLGLCPFHSEKTPSFTVSQDKGIYKCFGCGASGDTISFMMNYHGLSFPETLKELARRLGINIPEKDMLPSEKKELSRKEMAFKACRTAGEFYQAMLHSKAGKEAMGYFRQREFSQQLIEDFSLGYSPDQWNALYDELSKQNFSENAMLDAGLVIKKEDNSKPYDRFRGRAMFPISDHLGRIIGFGARSLDNDAKQAKYINSPQSLIYDKSNTLYGLHQAKSEIRNSKSAILVEGYADVLSLHQAGFTTAVASSGTALTKEQLRLLGRYAKKIYIAYDSDDAGIHATEKALEAALEENFEVLVVRLPKGEDPDSMVRQHGEKVFAAYLRDAINFLEFKLEAYKKEHPQNSPSEMAVFIRSTVKIISSIPDRLQHDSYLSKLASVLNLSESQLKQVYREKENLEKQNKHKEKQNLYKEKQNQNKEMQNRTGNSNESTQAKSREPIAQQQPLPDENKADKPDEKESMLAEEICLLFLAAAKNDALQIMTETFRLKSEQFITDTAKELFELLQKYCSGKSDPMKVIMAAREIDPQQKEYFINLTLSEETPSASWQRFAGDIEPDIPRMIGDTINRLQLRQIDRELADIKVIIRERKFEEQKSYLERLKMLSLKRKEITDSMNYD